VSARDEWVEWMNLAINDLDEARGVLDSARDRVSTTYNSMPGNAAGEPEAYSLRGEIEILERIGLAALKAWTVIALINGDSQDHDGEDEDDDEEDDLS
jgi:hypothetical protein